MEVRNKMTGQTQEKSRYSLSEDEEGMLADSLDVRGFSPQPALGTVDVYEHAPRNGDEGIYGFAYFVDAVAAGDTLRFLAAENLSHEGLMEQANHLSHSGWTPQMVVLFNGGRQNSHNGMPLEPAQLENLVRFFASKGIRAFAPNDIAKYADIDKARSQN